MAVTFNPHSSIKNIENFSHRQSSIKKREPAFGNLGNAITGALIASDRTPMIGISIIDLTSMILPRSIIDATRNGFAATETFLRESAGLVINCLIPSFAVLGMAKLFENTIMGNKFKNLGTSKFWANQTSNEMLSNAWLATSGNAKERTQKFVSSILDNIEGLTGKNTWKKISDIGNKKEIYENLTNAILRKDNKLLQKTTDELISNLGASRNIRLINTTPFSNKTPLKKLVLDSDLKNLTRDMKDLGHIFTKMADDAIPTFSKKLTKFINVKSLSGLALIIAIGASFQHFNRKLTKMRTGKDGFVGETDFKNAKQKVLTPEEKKKLNKNKILSLAWMAALAVASFGKLPNMKMFQFNGIFPTMNQCRAISATTYGGRILASQSENELKESRLRDSFTFINLYYLGDYVSKLYATAQEKLFPAFSGKLLKETVALDKNAGVGKKFWHWFKNTELKGFEELPNVPALKKARAFSQTSGLLYSMIVLGIIVPLYNKYRTDKANKEKIAAKANEIYQNTQHLLTNEAKAIFKAFLK